jgi:hypothetical protein
MTFALDRRNAELLVQALTLIRNLDSIIEDTAAYFERRIDANRCRQKCYRRLFRRVRTVTASVIWK